MQYKILIVDDETANLRLLERLFRRQCQVISARSGGEALELLKLHDVALIISDQRMPSMTGIEFLKRAAEMRPNTVRIILTGYTDVNALVEAINSGIVYKYVTKPWVNEDLQQTVARGLEHYKTIRSRYELKSQNERLTMSLGAARGAFVRLVADTLAARDAALRGHLQRTINYAAAIGYRFNLEDKEIEQLRLAAGLHETGQMNDTEDLENNLQTLADEENQRARRRAERGALTVASFPDMEEVAAAIRYHADRFDGKNSSEEISGEQIPLAARIIAVAKAYDKMTCSTEARAALSHEDAIEQLRAESGKRFDPAIVELFAEIKAIGKIRRAIEEGIVGMRLPRARVSCDAENLSTAELLHKFKTEPLLALDVLKIANTLGDAPTARLLPAMSLLGEERLRLLVRQHGLPAADEKSRAADARSARRAVAAQLLAAQTGVIHPDEAYALGLLAEIGEKLLLNLFPNEMLALEKAGDEDARRQVEVFGLDAAQISRWILESCRLPPALTEALDAPQSEIPDSAPAALLLYLADKIARTADVNQLVAPSGVGTDVLARVNLSRADLRAAFERTGSITEEQTIARQEIYALA